MALLLGLDIETTGLNIGEDRIIEFYGRLYDEDGNPLKTHFQRINPERSIKLEAQRVHKITIADLVAEPTWNVAGPKIHAFMGQADYLIAHNGVDFDLPFLNHEFERIGLAPIKTKMFDTLQNGRWATPVGKVPSLAELAFACDVEYDPDKAHAADYDVHVMMDCFFLAKKWRVIELDMEKEEDREAA